MAKAVTRWIGCIITFYVSTSEERWGVADFLFGAVPNPAGAPLGVIRPKLRPVVVVVSEKSRPIIQANQFARRPLRLDSMRENVECDAVP